MNEKRYKAVLFDLGGPLRIALEDEPYMRHARRKLAELAGDALAGKAAVSPALTQDLDACKYCRFRSICGFDESLPGCERRNLQMDSEEVLQRMRKEDENA